MYRLLIAPQQKDLPVWVSIRTETGTGWTCVTEIPDHGCPIEIV